MTFELFLMSVGSGLPLAVHLKLNKLLSFRHLTSRHLQVSGSKLRVDRVSDRFTVPLQCQGEIQLPKSFPRTRKPLTFCPGKGRSLCDVRRQPTFPTTVSSLGLIFS